MQTQKTEPEITLDTRGLEPPEPLFRTLDAVEEMQPGQTLRLLIHREPLMLYQHLQGMGIGWKIISYGNPDWIIDIGPLPKRR